MADKETDRAAVPLPPPLLFFACLVLGAGLEFAIPTRPQDLPWLLTLPAGTIVAGVSAVIALSAFKILKQHRTPVDPGKATVKIVRSGVFKETRNPLYLALLLLLTGIAMGAGSGWLLLTIPLLYYLLTRLAVIPEETYLSEKFADEYRDYAAAVRRWL